METKNLTAYEVANLERFACDAFDMFGRPRHPSYEGFISYVDGLLDIVAARAASKPAGEPLR